MPAGIRKRAREELRGKLSAARGGVQGSAEILAAMTRHTPLGKLLEQAQIWERWSSLAGPQLSPHGRPLRIKDGVLHVAAENSAWAQSFAYHKWAIVRHINRMAGKELVHDLFIVLEEKKEE